MRSWSWIRALTFFVVVFVLEGAFARGAAASWSTTTTMKIPRRWHTATELPDGRVLVTGGVNEEGARQSAEIYDPDTATWTLTKKVMSVARSRHTATLLSNGKVLIAGGFDASGAPTNTAELYNPGTDTFEPPITMAGNHAHHTAVELVDNRVLIAGGYAMVDMPTDSAELFDPETKTFTSTAPMPSAHAGHAAALLENGSVLVAGGRNPSPLHICDLSPKVEIFNPKANPANPWTAIADMNVGRAGLSAFTLPDGAVGLLEGSAVSVAELAQEHLDIGWAYEPATAGATTRFDHAAVLLPDGRVLVTGGRAPGGYCTLFDEVLDATEIFIGLSSTWNTVAPLKKKRWGHTATLLTKKKSGQVLVAGGDDQLPPNYKYPPPDNGMADAEIYTLEDDFWTTIEPMPHALYSPTATRLDDGQVLVTGGFSFYCSTPNGEPSQNAIIYRPEEKKFFTAAPVSYPRPDPTATLLKDGRVLVTGAGYKGADIISEAEVYDPKSDVWSDTGPMNLARWRHTATALPDGRVLVAGGSNDFAFLDGDAVASAELYDPTTNTWTPTGMMVVPRDRHTATLLNTNQVLIAGGTQETSAAEIYDIATQTFIPVGEMSDARGDHTATLLNDGRVLLAGGSVPDPNHFSSVEVFDPATGKFTSVQSMATPRTRHTATLLPTGHVLVVGGVSDIGQQDTAEIFDPALNRWTPALPLNRTRVAHTATLLDSGDVLVAGGETFKSTFFTTECQLLSSAEILRPLSLGAPCLSGGECGSGFCTDNVCCDTACDAGLCDACSADGVCAVKACESSFACEPATGACYTECKSIDQCVTDFVCGPDATCVRPPPAASTVDEASCDLGGAPAGGRAPRWPSLVAVAALAAASVLRRARRERRENG